MEKLELTEEQKKAIKSLERALKKCKKSNIYFHNCYGTLIAFDGNVVENVDDNIDELSCREGKEVNTSYKFDSWADDAHFIHLKDY